MKTRINQIVALAFLAIFILAGNVNAKGTEHNALSQENIESSLELEDWMINDNFWSTDNFTTFENATEELLQMESWMTNDNVWETENIVETEQKLTIETWMTDENIWN